ncbi:hypothetical protein D3C72_2217480 [compost metagenome]
MKQLFESLIHPHDLTTIHLIKDNRRIQHIDHTIQVLVLNLLLNADLLICFVDLIKGQKKLPLY